MARPVTGAFTFITSVNEVTPYDESTMRQIRRRAMDKTALARKSRGKHGKHNLLQYPVNIGIDMSEATSAASASVAAALLSQTIPPNVAVSGYEAMKQKYSFHLVDISALTTFHVTHGTVGCLEDDPAVLDSVLRVQQPSYLSHVPGRYGSCVALDAAVECVAARFRHFTHAPAGEIPDHVARLYVKALKALQRALDASDRVEDVNLLCATELLGLYELLRRDSRAWTHHSAGSCALIKAKGVSGYGDEFAKALLVSKVGQIFHDALAQRQPCFLEEPEWMPVLKSLEAETASFSDTSAIVVSLWRTICPLPRYRMQVTDIICAVSPIPKKVRARLNGLMLSLDRSMWQWHDDYKNTRKYTNISAESILREKELEALGLFFTALAILHRLIFALDPSSGTRHEELAQRYAAEVLKLDEKSQSIAVQSKLFTALKVYVAKSVQLTSSAWQVEVSQGDSTQWDEASTRLLPKAVFLEWCQLLGWK